MPNEERKPNKSAATGLLSVARQIEEPGRLLARRKVAAALRQQASGLPLMVADEVEVLAISQRAPAAERPWAAIRVSEMPARNRAVQPPLRRE